ncbi:MAG: hypothetical protein HY294_06770 [Candidatus Rokubacteria bacterium]|nr:hypothetical protein [Candidatus Rokubacteria bacterium]
MAQFTITVPDEFLQPLDELVTQTSAGTRERWLTNVVGQVLVDYQVTKEYGQQIQQRKMNLGQYWG